MLKECSTMILDGGPTTAQAGNGITSQLIITPAQAIAIYQAGFGDAEEWFERYDNVKGPTIEDWKASRLSFTMGLLGLTGEI